MLLRKKHLSGRTLGGPPYLNAPLQCPHLPVLKPARVLSLQKLEDRLGLKPALSSNNFCTSLQTSTNGSGRVRPRTAAGNSLGNRPRRRYFRPVLASIPALDAAISWFPSVFINANNLRTCLSVTNPPPLK
jgi:hypothetical protein